MSNWLGPFKTADDAIDALRRSVAEIIGADPDTWPYHKNAPIAISAVVGLREGEIKQLRKRHDALHAELETLKAWKEEVEKQEPVATVIKEGDSRYWTSERLWTFPDGKYPLYTQAGAQAQPAPSVPEGWKLVPIEPTQEMTNHVIDERLEALVAGKEHTFIDIYKAMLAAAPKLEDGANA